MFLFLSCNSTSGDIKDDDNKDMKKTIKNAIVLLTNGDIIQGDITVTDESVLIKTDIDDRVVKRKFVKEIYNNIAEYKKSIEQTLNEENKKNDNVKTVKEEESYDKKDAKENNEYSNELLVDSGITTNTDENREENIRKTLGKKKKSINVKQQNLSDTQEIILDQAFSLLNKKPNASVSVNGKNFTLDCIGTVAAIFYKAGIDIMKNAHEVASAGDNGVAIFYKSLKRNDALHSYRYPEVGDVVFWSNTWDRNGDGKFGNDPLTHVGVVTKVDDDGTIHYVHENYFYGIIVERMNLYRPTEHKDITGKIINSALYIGSSESKKQQHPWLSGDLFKEFGGVLKVSDAYKSDM